MALSRADAERLAGTHGVVRDATGGVVGNIVSVLLEEDTGQPSWVCVEGVASDHDAFVPLVGARVHGTDIVLAYPRTVIDQAPQVAVPRQLTPSDELTLHAYYASQQPANQEHVADAGSMTRAEEQLRVGVRVRPRERVRLVKHVVTENVAFTVPVQREELRIERIPFDEDDQAAGVSDSSEVVEVGEYPFDQDEIDIVLHEERVEWSTEVVPVERVRVRVQVVTTDLPVSANLRAENVELVQDPSAGPPLR